MQGRSEGVDALTSNKPRSFAPWLERRRLTVSRSVLAAVALGLAVLAWVVHSTTGLWLFAFIALAEIAAAIGWLIWPGVSVGAANVIAILGVIVATESYLLWAGRPDEPQLEPPLSEWQRMPVAHADVYVLPRPAWYMDPVLGSTVEPNTKTRERRYLSGRLLYDNTYTIDAHGFRETPKTAPNAENVLLFGCSITWGFGLNDEQTYPWLLSERLGRRVRSVNMGILGSGPNAMLALLDANRERAALAKGKVRGAYFLTFLDPKWGHHARVLGRVPWGAGAPAYKLNEAEPTRVLPNGRMPLTFDEALIQLSYTTGLLGYTLAGRRYNPHYSDRDLELPVAIVLDSHRRLQQRYQIPLTVVLLHTPAARDVERRFSARLAAAGVEVLRANLPPNAYLPNDGHPNVWGASMLADLVHAHLESNRPDASR